MIYLVRRFFTSVNMFMVVEFEEAVGGGIAIVRSSWLDPRKKQVFWPPHKQSCQFTRARGSCIKLKEFSMKQVSKCTNKNPYNLYIHSALSIKL